MIQWQPRQCQGAQYGKGGPKWHESCIKTVIRLCRECLPGGGQKLQLRHCRDYVTGVANCVSHCLDKQSVTSVTNKAWDTTQAWSTLEICWGIYTHTFNGPLSGTTRVSRYQKGKTNLDFIEARDSEWQWHQLGHMQVCNSLQTDTTPAPHHSVFLRAGCPSCHPTNSVKALKGI